MPPRYRYIPVWTHVRTPVYAACLHTCPCTHFCTHDYTHVARTRMSTSVPAHMPSRMSTCNIGTQACAHCRHTWAHACLRACLHTFLHVCLLACLHARLRTCPHVCLHTAIKQDISRHTDNKKNTRFAAHVDCNASCDGAIFTCSVAASPSSAAFSSSSPFSLAIRVCSDLEPV